MVRQRQYIGKLMRGMDLEPIRAVLAARGEKASQEAQRFKRVEHWRNRLISEGEPALEALMAVRTGMDRDEWLTRVNAARAERESSGRAGRLRGSCSGTSGAAGSGKPLDVRGPQSPGGWETGLSSRPAIEGFLARLRLLR